MDGTLTSVSCVSPTNCLAVGSDAASVLIESWNGKAWRRMNAPVPAGSKYPSLTGVSCASDSNCVAVGTAGSSLDSTAFGELWNGRTWRVSDIR